MLLLPMTTMMMMLLVLRYSDKFGGRRAVVRPRKIVVNRPGKFSSTSAVAFPAAFQAFAL